MTKKEKKNKLKKFEIIKLHLYFKEQKNGLKIK
jgi:hypothetical protein